MWLYGRDGLPLYTKYTATSSMRIILVLDMSLRTSSVPKLCTRSQSCLTLTWSAVDSARSRRTAIHAVCRRRSQKPASSGTPLGAKCERARLTWYETIHHAFAHLEEMRMNEASQSQLHPLLGSVGSGNKIRRRLARKVFMASLC